MKCQILTTNPKHQYLMTQDTLPLASPSFQQWKIKNSSHQLQQFCCEPEVFQDQEIPPKFSSSWGSRRQTDNPSIFGRTIPLTARFCTIPQTCLLSQMKRNSREKHVRLGQPSKVQKLLSMHVHNSNLPTCDSIYIKGFRLGKNINY